ncbi:hypothetical protein OSB04_031206 [Centaurea solstitialis]|uniref:Uncharacterized protein n=1 Tax=Centaurea solstitialis TaxID=347529 RepID=A0AA38SGL3_9ASTR|nr:hypothetical protein OSB04_031206 [Centaurea solstitialis]
MKNSTTSFSLDYLQFIVIFIISLLFSICKHTTEHCNIKDVTPNWWQLVERRLDLKSSAGLHTKTKEEIKENSPGFAQITSLLDNIYAANLSDLKQKAKS